MVDFAIGNMVLDRVQSRRGVIVGPSNATRHAWRVVYIDQDHRNHTASRPYYDNIVHEEHLEKADGGPW